MLRLPVPLRQTFTYRHQSSESDEIRLGARIIVPFGRQKLTGYAVGIHDELDPETGLDAGKVAGHYRSRR